MNIYSMVMYCLSSLGFFMIFFSMYLLITVPTKLTPFSRFVIHGHDMITGFAQLFLTIGLQTCFILPCASIYTPGVLTRFEIMSTINQLWIMAALFSSSSMFALLLCIHRVFAVSMRLSDRTKKIILKSFFLQWFLQIIGMAIFGLKLEDAGTRGRTVCVRIIEEYPKEMDTFHGVNFILTDGIEFIIIVVSVVVIVAFYLFVASICGAVLYISIRDQGKSTQSAQFLANQRRIIMGIIYFGAVELGWVGGPVVIIGSCIIFHIGNYVVSHCSLVLLCLYPISGPYYVLMSNADYNKRVNEIIANVRSKLCFSCSSCPSILQGFKKNFQITR